MIRMIYNEEISFVFATRSMQRQFLCIIYIAYFVCEVDEFSVQRIDKHPNDNCRTVDDKQRPNHQQQLSVFKQLQHQHGVNQIVYTTSYETLHIQCLIFYYQSYDLLSASSDNIFRLLPHLQLIYIIYFQLSTNSNVTSTYHSYS